MAQIGTDDVLVALVYALNKAADAEQQLAQVMQQAEAESKEPDAPES